MNKRVDFSNAEIASPEDLSSIGIFAMDGDELIHGAALGWPAHWSRITVAELTSDVVQLSPGAYHKEGAVYTNEAPIEVNLQSYKPPVSGDERWVALILRGSAVTSNATRAFETSEEPLTESVPVNQSTPKYHSLDMSVVVQTGPIAPPPALRPTVAENDCCVAFVRLTTSGIAEIVSNSGARVKTVYELDGRLTAVEQAIEVVVETTATIQTDMANLAAKFKLIPDPRIFRQITRDVSITRQLLNFPEEARNYYFDQGLLRDFWDFAYVGADMRVLEGIRFPYENQRETQLRLLNPASSDIDIYDNTLVLPAYTERRRIENKLGSLRKDIANTVHTITTATQHQTTHTSIRYGETINVCENTVGWQSIGGRKAGEIFAVGGQEFVSKGKTDNPWNQTATAQNGHSQFAAQRVIRDTFTSTYTTYHTEQFGLSGAVYGQTFVCSQIMVATSLELYFTRVGSEGDVLLCICEITPSGAPDYSSVIAKVNKPQGDLQVNAWNKFAIPPTLLEQGKRYGFFTVTTGNHQLAATGENAFPGGTMFVSSDGIWSQGDIREDISFRLNAARFEASRTVVPFENLQLTGGMSELRMVYQGWEPDFTRLVWEVKAEGQSEWVPMDEREDNPLANLPANVQLRAVFVGTEDVAPSIILDTNALSITGRMKHNMEAVSQELDFGFATDELQIVMNVDAYQAINHDFTPSLIIDGSVVAATSVSETVDPEKPSRSTFVANFTLGAAASACRLKVDGHTNSQINVPFVQDIQLNAF
ncbi:hypothetical protein [Pararhizobium haloflavum]|uniref:hypothetical protein n=1 Tax=Pararhizobium haloflavum TaxID=2037914 RepID=UPI000C191851|nr:hypothetical protein [Pararhizobium haloflavum]